MARFLAVLAVVLSAPGCREQPPAANPAGSRPQGDLPSKSASDLPPDRFRLAIEDVRSTGSADKRVFRITVPSSARRVCVFLGPIEYGQRWSLVIDPSPEAERNCSFEVSQPVVTPTGSKGQSVTVVGKLSTPTSTALSPLGMNSQDTVDTRDIVSFAADAKAGLHKQDAPLVLGHLKLGTSAARSFTLYVLTRDADPTRE
jgi:hypothetical protein